MRLLSTIFLLLLSHQSSQALQTVDYRFHTMPETSYYGGIHSIAKDSLGQIWFSGHDAVFVYNGNKYTQMNDLLTSYSSSSYWAYGQIVTDSARRIYVASNQGLLRFNYQNKTFERIITGNIGAISSDEDGEVWFSHNNNVKSLNFDNGSKITDYPLPLKIVVSALTTTNDHVYVASNEKLFKLNKKNKQYTLFALVGSEGYIIKDIMEYKGSVYVLTNMNGLFEYDKSGHLIRHHNLSLEYGNSTSSKKLYLDSSNIIWIATQAGVVLLNPETKEQQLLKPNLHYAYSLPNSSVWSIYPDPDGGVWVGTYGGKLAYMTLYDNDVSYFKATIGGLNSSIVSSFEEDRDGNLWIGTEGGGINYWNRKTDKFSYYTRANNTGVLSNMIKKLSIDKETDRLQIGTFNGGLREFDKSRDVFKDLHVNHPSTQQPLSVYEIAYEGNSGIWMSDPDAALAYRDNKRGTIEFVSFRDEANNIVRMQIETLFRGKGNELWLITREGVYVADVKTRRVLKRYFIEDAPYSVNNVFSFCVASNSDMWFGTHGGGVNRLSKDGQYINFSEKEGLAGKYVFGILEDEESKNIWFSTNDGLYYYDNEAEKINKFPVDTHNLCGTFYIRSCFKTSKNEMLFGGTDGFILFTPSKIKQNNQQAKVFFTDLLINNQRITNETEGSPLQKDISTLSYTETNENKIVLTHKQSSIEILLSTNSYLESNKNQYSYRMLGLSSEWYLLPQGQKTVQFYNLPSGKYFLEIKAANNDGVWSNEVSVLHFEVKPSPFLSIWAYMVYALILLYVVYFIWRYVTNKKIFKHRLEMEQIKEQNMKKLTQARINFFTNISHDLKTPLTLVLDPLKQLKEIIPNEKSSNANAYILLIEKNVNRIQRMISQLLQFREIESQKITLNQQSGDIIQYVSDLFSLFELYANKKGVETDMSSELERFQTKFDYEAIEKIFTNLFSNAIKYTVESGYVGVKIKKISEVEASQLMPQIDNSAEYLSFAITNTGSEIAEDKKETIFKSFSRLSSGRPAFEESTGLGLAIVKELVTTLNGSILLDSADSKVTFTIVLPFFAYADERDNDEVSYNYTISEIENILVETEEVNLHDKRSRKAYNIVLVEDDPTLRNYMEERLSEFYNVYTASNGNEGIEKAERIFPQLVITDLMMPEANGFDVCHNLRSNIKTSHIPIVVLSALGKNTGNKIKALEAGANVFIDKPFDMDYLLKQVDNLIKNQNEMKELYSKKYIAEPSKITISSADEELLKKAMEHIEQNIDNIEYNVDSFVSDMGIGRTLLYQKINDILGMSIKEFIMDIRLKRGAQLLEESDLTISEISDRIGFNNPKYFSICFKKHFELTPTEFRKKS